MNDGIKINLLNDELLITGNKDALIELSNYINTIANSINENDHLHLDDLSLISNNSSIKNLIIEKK